MKNAQQILDRIEQIKSKDVFGIQCDDLVSYLDFDDAKPFLEPDISEVHWEKETKTPKQLMTEYMPFAWEKANDKRGLSAMRSMSHYTAWLWLDGDEELYPTLENYTDYGIPQLIEICKYLGIDHQQFMREE